MLSSVVVNGCGLDRARPLGALGGRARVPCPPVWLLAAALVGGAAGGAAKERGPEAAPLPVFSVPGGVFSNTLTLTLSTSSGTVRYTIDGSEPEVSSRAASGPLVLTNSVLLRARTFAPGQSPSPAVSHAFTRLAEDMIGFTSSLPLIIVNTY